METFFAGSTSGRLPESDKHEQKVLPIFISWAPSFPIQKHISAACYKFGSLFMMVDGTLFCLSPSRKPAILDMIMRDADEICCSILYGQDNQSPISAETTHVLYVAYAPDGIPAELVDTQLRKIEENIRMFSRTAVVEQCRLLSAEGG